MNPFSFWAQAGSLKCLDLASGMIRMNTGPLPNPTGLPGVFEGYTPPHYTNMRQAVDALQKEVRS
ncbi:hypothetical protein [Methanosarcina sp. UBA5]|uniref:hypothetical protein n=1 Tax=Methanosarcina sp. UBA5 TaxID=1915593 RepID=UPI0025FCE4D1|nr:hypothetical protein [Methanosarcina sp. UBA5]